MACIFYCLLVQKLIAGIAPVTACDEALNVFKDLKCLPAFIVELPQFLSLSADRIASLAETEIASSGYVLHTLTASIWCLLTSDSFDQTLLKAVNLGSDSDTTGTVAGGLAGACYGVQCIPAGWKSVLARHEEIDLLFAKFMAGKTSAGR